jgi:hypothetical protein
MGRTVSQPPAGHRVRAASGQHNHLIDQQVQLGGQRVRGVQPRDQQIVVGVTAASGHLPDQPGTARSGSGPPSIDWPYSR